MGTIHEATASGGVSLSGTAKARIERNLVMSAEADDVLADLARRTGHKEGDVLRLALAMFKSAVDAKEQGKHVGVAGKPEALDLELVGF
jgi:hypothetical protein